MAQSNLASWSEILKVSLVALKQSRAVSLILDPTFPWGYSVSNVDSYIEQQEWITLNKCDLSVTSKLDVAVTSELRKIGGKIQSRYRSECKTEVLEVTVECWPMNKWFFIVFISWYLPLTANWRFFVELTRHDYKENGEGPRADFKDPRLPEWQGQVFEWEQDGRAPFDWHQRQREHRCLIVTNEVKDACSEWRLFVYFELTRVMTLLHSKRKQRYL